LQVFRRSSPNLPGLADPRIHWEHTLYLNLILQCFVYVLTVGVCTRSGAKEIEILRKCSQVVYASPSSRQMESKGTEEKIVYPRIVFHVDNFEELQLSMIQCFMARYNFLFAIRKKVFSDCILRDSECLCMEITAYNRLGVLQGVLFEAVVRYSALKTAHDLQVNGEPLTTRRFGSNTNLQVLGRRPRPTDKILDPSGVSQSRTFLRILAARSEALAEVAVHFGTGTAPPPLEFCVRPGVARSVSASCRMTKNSYPLVGVENLVIGCK
uniref:SPATA6 domain-containing protein n=1 Tax=Schistocephalus solidus TaxID=70667 RepID=A0A183SGF6_SCHSO